MNPPFLATAMKSHHIKINCGYSPEAQYLHVDIFERERQRQNETDDKQEVKETDATILRRRNGLHLRTVYTMATMITRRGQRPGHMASK